MTETSPPAHPGARILIVDDEPANVTLLERMLTRAGYTNHQSTTNPMNLPELLAEQLPDLMLLDLNMPGMDGFEVMEFMDELNTGRKYLPILVLTADTSTHVRQRALASGATDFLTKPFDRIEVLLRINNMLHTRSLNMRLEAANTTLEARVRDRTAALELAQRETVDRLALAAEYRDDETGGHIQRVGEIAGVLALRLGLDFDTAEMVAAAAPLHDLGKIAVPDSVLLKPGPLNDDEFAVIKRHTTTGHALLKDSESPLLQMASVMALHHHDRWDGNGYGTLSGSGIPIVARIVSVADVFDALTHRRVYKPAWPADEAIEFLRQGSGTQFDPEVVEAFLDAAKSELQALL